MDKVIIKDLIARGIIGVNDWERKKPQEILINLELYGDLTKVGKTDQVQDSLNYRTIAKEALRIAETAERFTVEALAADIADACMSFEGLKKAVVRIEKPGAVRFSESVGVEIERHK
ncbi:MAG: dihydroneopterin aldolase [Anaerolineales bacterium]|nr:dihydroneopterin aldolase [Anaerolineales bacterium]MBS3751883.1 dihydroneopterin aldolase [Anaerolineales bacterium]